MITGEPLSIEKNESDPVTAGTVNGTGSFEMKALKIGSDTLLAQIIDMVNKASRSKAPIQNMADRISRYFVPIVVLISILSFTVWAIWGPDPVFVFAFANALTVLIIACLCALGLATPMSIMVGTGRGATAGVLIKEAKVIEEMEKVNVLVIDKTGTITERKPSLKSVKTFVGSISEDEILQSAASLETNSEHPLAEAIVRAAKAKSLALSPVENFQSITGLGITGTINAKKVFVGNTKLIKSQRISLEESNAKEVEEKQSRGETVMYVVISGQLAGYLSAADPIKQNSKSAINEANVGIAMGTGTDVAIQSAGITLVKGDLQGIIRARKLSKEVMKNIRQNLFFAFIYNVIGIPIAAGIMYPFFGLLLSPMLAALAMSLSSVSVIVNSLRLRTITI